MTANKTRKPAASGRPPARKSTAAAPTSATPHPDQILASAWEAFSGGRLREAEKLAAGLAKQHANHPHVLYLRGLIALGDERVKAGLALLERVKDAPELALPVALAKGQAQLHLGQAELAMTTFQEALAYKPDDAMAHYWLAMSLLAQEDVSAGRQYLRRAILLDAKLAAAHYELGVLALSAGDAAAALSSFLSAQASMPESAQVANNLGLAQQMAKDLDAAVGSFERAIALQGAYAEAWFNLGHCQRAMGREEAATKSLNKAFSLAPHLRKVLQGGTAAR